ncbi:proline-, glutamic acid- and leucine-rich protein 1 [Sitodiplosis mosellana]|uniref:proline-, glutamic acid- and leucine-rich protein 1 n=1 Tax=Sitodiplosis mosellana TaxID=263140 RepID=UPI00244408C1|nr:proline-, glutamic acid- and leucine-rich protein 1 [Sitodiplosis mosellana]
MNETLNIVSTAAALPNKKFVQLLNAFEHHQTFSQKAAHELDLVVSLITNNLNSHDKKHEGLLLLRSFLVQCQLDIIEQKGNLWLSLCTKICAQKKPAATVCLGYEVISDILVKSVHIPDLGKAIASNLLSKIIESVSGLPPECHLATLKCLETCMKLYAGPSGASRANIDRFLGTFIDSTNQALVIQSGKCLLQLQQVRGGGCVQGISVKGAWSNLQSQLLGSLHTVLNQLFANATETYDGFNFDEEITALKTVELNLSPEPIQRATQLLTRFKNLTDYLRIALCEPFPVTKAVQPGLLFSIIARGLAVNCATLAKNAITDNIAIAAILPQVHGALFRLLDTLILLLRTNLLPFANHICQLIVQSLKWTSSGKASGFKRPYISIRQAAYRTLSLWCKTAKYGSLVETIAEDLIKFIIQDITPYQSEVTLKVLAGSRKYLSKKARQKLHKAQNDASNIAQTHSKSFNPHNTKIIYTDSGNEPLCEAALACLVDVLHAAGCFIKPLHQKILQENIVVLSLNVANATPKKSHLYFDNGCRAGLFSTLYALTQSPHHLCPPPIQYAAEVFKIAQIHDVRAEIRDKCSEYLRGIEKILHPQKEIFYFPTNVNDVAEAFKKNAEDLRTRASGLADSDDDDNEQSSDEENEDVEMNEDASAKPQSSEEISKDESFMKEVIDAQSDSITEQAKDKSNGGGEEPVQLVTTHTETQQEETIKIVVEESSEEKPLTSPPRKSARLSAKRPDSAAADSDTSVTTKPESPVPRRRSLRRSSTSSQDATPFKAEEEPAVKKLPTIVETGDQTDVNTKATASGSIALENETQKSEKALVDELAAAFVEEFIDDDE